MRLAVSVLCFCPLAFGQSAPAPAFQLPDKLLPAQPNIWEQRLKDLKLTDPSHVTVQAMAVAVKPKACAIPLLNALPPLPKVIDRMPTITPPENVEHSNAVMPQIGLPACEPGAFTLKLQPEKH
jgi:hypothetical protein